MNQARTGDGYMVGGPAVMKQHSGQQMVPVSADGDAAIELAHGGQKVHRTEEKDGMRETASAILYGQQRTFYKTSQDSGTANCLRKLRCGCLDPRYTLTSESIKMNEWHCCNGGCCTRKTSTIDVDEIVDMSLVETLGLGYLFVGRGHFKIYFKEKGDRGREPQEKMLFYIEHAQQVFKEYSEHVSRLNNLKFGMARPDTTAPEIMYFSKDDTNCIKCCRTCICCGGCCFPTTTISKRHIRQSSWGCGSPPGSGCGMLGGCIQRRTLLVDLDTVQDVELERACWEQCCLGTGTMVINCPADVDQQFVKVRFMGNSKEVYKELDHFVNVLNNRNRIIGEGAMPVGAPVAGEGEMVR